MPRGKKDPRKAYAYKTAVFQIHKPSSRKAAMLRDALKRNHLAYGKLLQVALLRLEELAEISGDTQYRTNKARIDAVKKDMAQRVKPLPLCLAAKAGLQEDLANSCAAYLALMDKYKADVEKENEKPKDKRKKLSTPGLPTNTRLTPHQKAHKEAYNALRDSLTLDEENAARDAILRENKSGLTRPILYLKNRISDGFLILYDEQKNRYLLYLNLSPANGRFARKISLAGLLDIRTGEVFPENKTNATGALFTVKFGGDYQLAEFMKKAKSASAKLMERDGRFEVHVTFEFIVPKIETTTYLGVDRGIYNLASMCVIDDDGNILAEENFDGRALRYVQQRQERRQRKEQKRGKKYKSATRRTEADKAVHATANAIVAMAVKHKAKVVIENLSNFTGNTGKRKRNSFNRLLTRSQYAKLQHALEYKMNLAGLEVVRVNGNLTKRSKMVTVAAPGTSQTCPECGYWNSDNRKKEKAADGKSFVMDKFLCLECGYSHDADLNAARVIALKRKWREGLPESQRAKTVKVLSETEYAFSCYLKSLRDKRNH